MENSNTTQLNKEKMKTRVIGLIVILALAGGIYYSKSSMKEPVEDSPSPDSEITPVEDSPSQEVTPKEEVSTESSNASTNTKPEIVTADNTKFNTLLQEGSKAFMDKNYSLAIKTYNEALAIDASDVVYIRLYGVYNAQGDIKKAEEMLNKAIAKNPSYTEYWNTKLIFLDQKTNTSFDELKKIYTDGLNKVDSRTKLNLVTVFARIAESNKEYAEAITAWQKAIELYPTSKAVYQAEIDRLKTL